MDATPASITPTSQRTHGPQQVPSWMTIGEGRAAMAASGRRSLPVVGHDELIGLITLEALGGQGIDEHAEPPAADGPLVTVMDWHLVQVPPDAEERDVLKAYTDAAWTWLTHRGLEAVAPHGPTMTTPEGSTT